ncbi:MAG: 30S ribosomal protein S3 [Candidatus Levybacteria bacterium RIFCSPHIGHO2_02_FULL_42_12]|nr:MAG: 30S ribosomal protein S3 [Candidatus Levybacteria bacterium RIFCSPHIGHO2_01_FULL_42_15]OGH31417.1 MAG: 30S ribosomal protein S3 [Candidatus Levybacteria bacterium RIFCSPHIGHO2_02_FULL_42_12]OGH42681.1 MAG: 30S ribosomal protein S3 [Candidatus Levybacteria bacterium RIFCSPLOWO2_01_FULL_42_15]
MGQKVNPKLLRLGSLYTWDSRWFDEKRYKDLLLEDVMLRKALSEKLQRAGVARTEIERSINSLKVIVYVMRPGIVIGRAGAGLEELKKYLLSILSPQKGNGKHAPKLDIRIEHVKEPNLDAHLVAKNIADQLARRLPHKRILAGTADKVMSSGAKGVRIVLSGRIAGSEIGRREKIQTGTVPLSTIREKIQFASVPSLTKKGYIGVKVWINQP